MEQLNKLSDTELCELHKECIEISQERQESCEGLYHMMCEIADEISKRLSSNYDI